MAAFMKFGKRKPQSRADLQEINKPEVHRGKMALFSKGGDMAESKMEKKELSFMKAKGAPKSMIKHEVAEMKAPKKMAAGGMTKMPAVKTAAPSKDGIAQKGKTKGTVIKMAGAKGMKRGGKCG